MKNTGNHAKNSLDQVLLEQPSLTRHSLQVLPCQPLSGMMIIIHSDSNSDELVDDEEDVDYANLCPSKFFNLSTMITMNMEMMMLIKILPTFAALHCVSTTMTKMIVIMRMTLMMNMRMMKVILMLPKPLPDIPTRGLQCLHHSRPSLHNWQALSHSPGLA